MSLTPDQKQQLAELQHNAEKQRLIDCRVLTVMKELNVPEVLWAAHLLRSAGSLLASSDPETALKSIEDVVRPMDKSEVELFGMAQDIMDYRPGYIGRLIGYLGAFIQSALEHAQAEHDLEKAMSKE